MDHKHCLSCINSYCTASDCPVEYCKNGCGVSLHRCKWAEHDEHICPEAIVCCSNALYGCKEEFARKSIKNHLPYCPASIFECRQVHARKLVHSAGEATLQTMHHTIDEQLLGGDLSVVNSPDHLHEAPPTLGISTRNCGYALMERKCISDSIGTRQKCCSHRSKEALFLCNQIVRRDEFVSHWKGFHLDVQLNDRLIQRCPMLAYGCTYGRENLLPSPSGTTLNYNREDDTFLARSPPSLVSLEEEETREPSRYESKIQEKKELALYGYGDEDESYDVLSQLPAEVLLKILELLDSVSLWNVSLVNQYIRRVCFNLVHKKGIVYRKWERVEDPSRALGFTWACSPKVWSYSKVSDNVSGWSFADTPSLAAHLLSCEVYKSVSRTWSEGDKKKLPGFNIG